MAYRFGEFTLGRSSGLRPGDTPVALEPQALRLLEYLIEHRARIVTKQDLIEEIWQGRAITDAALATRIRAVRRALGDDAAQQAYIRTYPKRGFQFAARVEAVNIADRQPSRGALAIAAVLALVLLAAWFLLRAPGVDGGTAGRPSVAVLRFDNLGEGAGDRSFADGLTEDLTAHLSRYRELFVISAGTVLAYGDGALRPLDAAREFGVSYVVRGSVRRDGGRIRVTNELLEIATGRTLWAERHDRALTDIFAVQDDISRSIAGTLVPQILKDGGQRATGVPTADMGAWELYLEARLRQGRYNRADQSEALRLARRAVVMDPGFAAAHSVMARALGTLFFFEWTEEPGDTMAEARAAARRAITLDDSDPQAYAALGYIQRFAGQAEPAIANLERAVALNPNDARIRLELAHTLDWFRLQARALPQIELAIRLSPRDPLIQTMHFYKGHILFHLGRHDAALAAARQLGGVAISDTWRVFHHLLRAANLAQLERSAEAAAAIADALAINPSLSVSAMRAQFERSRNHPENRRAWLASLERAGLPP
jgi:TolB-like protein/DNA-binding winged helix-turn-helix (wHTH) protein/Flp pilus assembly protein TadD